MIYLIKLITIGLLVNFVSFNAVWAGENSTYNKKLVKNRAKLYEKNDGVSGASRDLYIYADDKDIQESLNGIKNTPKGIKGETVNIVSPVIGVKSKVRNVNIVVDAKKGIKVDRDKLGIKKDQEINIASPTIDDGARVRDINITVDAKRGGIEIK